MPIIDYLTKGTLPKDPTKASRLRIRSAHYIMINDKLYKWGFSLLLLKCLTKEQGRAILEQSATTTHKSRCKIQAGGFVLRRVLGTPLGGTRPDLGGPIQSNSVIKERGI
ncbi:hypothetical protein ACS0TY_033528 [Phlomoides rotata]